MIFPGKACLLFLLAPTIGLAAEPEAAPSATVEEGFLPLFDGKTLDGWHPHTGVPAEHVGGRWVVRDGAIVGDQDPPGRGGFLVTDRTFKDVILRLDVKVDYPVDSGIFLRMGEDGKSHQVTLDHRPKGDIGGIYLPWTQSTVFKNPAGVKALRPEGLCPRLLPCPRIASPAHELREIVPS